MIRVPSSENPVEQLEEEQMAANDAPPSSLFDQLRGVSSAFGLVKFFMGATDVVGNTGGSAVALALFNIIPILIIVLGWVNRDDCPVNSYIPVWLIVAGASSLLKSVIKFAHGFRGKDHRGHPLCVRLLESLMSIFIVIWLIVGSVWVYSAYDQVTYDPQNDVTYCNRLAYVVSFLFITFTYVLLALCALFLCCCCCCCVWFCQKDKDTTEPTQA